MSSYYSSSSHHHHHHDNDQQSPTRRGPTISNPYTYSSRKYSTSRGARTSAYRRQPRPGFISSIWRKIQSFLRTILGYAKAHPFKIVVPVVMALASGGALTALAAKVGLGGLGKTIESMLGTGRGAKGGYDAWYGSQNVGDLAGAAGGAFSGSGLLASAVKVAAGFL